MGKLDQLKAFFEKSKRVWLVLKKPTTQEFKSVTKISALGILVLGAFGFLVSILMKIFIA